ncbi:MAG: transposase [Cyclobacteriaceae bacterium]
MRLSSGKVYHIYNRGINRKKIFFEDRNYDFFLQRFRRYVLGHIGLLTYCLMPNHFHLLVRINEFEFKEDVLLTGVEKAFKNFFISYSKSINQAYNRTGALLQYKFKRKEVNDEDYLSWLIYYIHANPVKSGFTKSLEDWRYSSYNEILCNKSKLVQSQEVLDWFGGEEEFIDFHQRNLANESNRKAEEDFDWG